MDKILYENKFLAIVERDGYYFSREVRCKGVIVSVLPFRFTNSKVEFMARLEICPAHGPGLGMYSITGGLEPGHSIEKTVLKELWEEAGYRATTNELVGLGQVYPSKSSDTRAHLFAINVSQKQQSIPQGDGTPLEATASVEWINYNQSLQIEDPLFITMMTRFLNLMEDKSNGNTWDKS